MSKSFLPNITHNTKPVLFFRNKFVLFVYSFLLLLLLLLLGLVSLLSQPLSLSLPLIQIPLDWKASRMESCEQPRQLPRVPILSLSILFFCFFLFSFPETVSNSHFPTATAKQPLLIPFDYSKKRREKKVSVFISSSPSPSSRCHG